ncbi:hypothetical protein FIE12Z_10879 [Fusarium flagelliforme]|uniref:Rhodanese domain-containing protein n=1 Tax=Fusarium flagelliforme TaxID=2675880 RepID=A0A395MAL8_9HYPO|nr:hypothetical protein FIE12Z_10879 [Fusarium flagelliforme]
MDRNTDEIIGDRNHPRVSEPKSGGKVVTAPSVLTRQTRGAEILHRFQVTNKAAAGLFLQSPFHERVKIVSPQQVHDMIADKVAGYESSDVAIIDLRTPLTPNLAKDGDKYNFKLKGAYPIPFLDHSVIQKLVVTENSPAADKAWKALAAFLDSPLKALAAKPVIIVHCFQSTSRTPSFVGGYMKHFGNRNKQQVSILEGGFTLYKDKFKDDTIQKRDQDEVDAEKKATKHIEKAISGALS